MCDGIPSNYIRNVPFGTRRNKMKVKELVELLLQQPQDADVLIDCRDIDDVIVYAKDGFYLNNTDEIVVFIDT